MVTKSKKWKTIISFAAFAFSVSLMLGCGLSLAYKGYVGDFDLMTADYQKTESFRNYMQNRLENFMSIASGGNIGWYNGYYNDYYDDYYDSTGTYITDDILESEVTAQTENEAEYTLPGDTEISEEEKLNREKWTKNYMQAISQDKNLLYRISYDGKELYSNMEGIEWEELGEALPEGYNFLLYFDGEKVTIIKDNNEQNIYGDGYYREGMDWYVPGYKNFIVDEQVKKVNIIMFASKIPVIYSMARYDENGYYSAGNGLYYIADDTKTAYQSIRINFLGMAVGAILFLLYFLLWRSEKQKADVWLGKVTGKIWIEAKLLLAAAAVYLIQFCMVREYVYDGGMALTEIYYEFTYESLAYAVPALSEEILRLILGQPILIVVTFWLIYLFVNDIRRNKGKMHQGVVSRFLVWFETKNLTLDYSKRAVRRYLFVAVTGTILYAVLLIVSFILWFHSYRFDSWTGPAAFFIILLVICFAVFLAVCYWYLTKTGSQTKDLELLAKQIQAIHKGDYSKENELPENSELKSISMQLADIQQGMESAIEERMKSEHMKVELVANVSHDIKTPLTSIISYVQFLKQEQDLPEHVKDYIRILDEKSARLNHMVSDVFEVSKAASGQLPVKMERLDYGKLLRQTLADMEEQIASAQAILKAEIPEHEIMIFADGNRMYRVFQNLIVNAFKYSLEGSRVYLTLKEDGDFAVASVKNTSRLEIPSDNDFTGRFVRGDESRTDGGSGLGLSIAKSFTEACGGRFILETDADLFVVKIRFKIVP